MTTPPYLRTLLARFQDQGQAHLSLDDALDGLPSHLRGIRPPGLPHSIWELVEHIRIAQRDILEFSTDREYRQGAWPESYWPPAPAPPDDTAWGACLDGLREDREALRALASDPDIDLGAATPHAERAEQTHLRALLLAQDHAAYHIGQVVLTRKLLEAGE